jgi:hypothetical protein
MKPPRVTIRIIMILIAVLGLLLAAIRSADWLEDRIASVSNVMHLA